ncbi:ArsR/SmtB family transcription factor [Streptomyces canus]|uniref:ArsR/SmtB family transcription factor n=1 Tax=Streptomyces canus TaxID=58343 RepID=UPI003F4C9224
MSSQQPCERLRGSRHLSTTDLAHRRALAPSTVSAHLSVLRESGLLASRRQGNHVL